MSRTHASARERCEPTRTRRTRLSGCRGYEVLDNPNIVVEIAEWESAEARAAAIQQAMDSGAYAPLAELLGAPFRATVIKQLP